MYVGDVRNIGDVGHVDHVHAIKAASVPGKERIMRAHREPSDIPEAERRVVSKANEEDERRRPHRPIAHKRRSRPPAPVVAVVKPAAIVIRRPAPRLIRNPGPAIIRFPHPASSPIWRPARVAVVRLPNVALARYPYP